MTNTAPGTGGPVARRWTTTTWTLVLALVWLAVVGASWAQDETLRLPLPIDGVTGVQSFDSIGPTAAVLTGLQLPAEGPLTAWSGVFSTLGADGTLGTAQNGGWTGKLPSKWVRVIKPGYVVAGFRLLIRTAPAPVQTRQLQVFWRPWTGSVSGSVVESPVYGQKAGVRDTVRIIELRLPDGAIPTGLYGQIQGGSVVQASLIVKRTGVATLPSITPASHGPSPVDAPQGPQAPAPVAPLVPPLLN